MFVPGKQTEMVEVPTDEGTGFGSVEWIPAEPLQLRQLFENPVGVWEGSSITVIEELDIVFEVEDPSVVSVDKNWFGDKTYVGSYRLNSLSEVFVNPEDEGYITSTLFRIRRESNYVLTTPIGASPGLHQIGTIDLCNLLLTGVTTGGNVGTLSLTIQPRLFNGTMRSRSGIIPASIYEGEVIHRIKDVNVYTRPGIRWKRATRRTYIGNQAQIRRQPVNLPIVCGSASTCYDEFLNFIRISRGSAFITAQDALDYLASVPATDPIFVAVPDDISENVFVCEGGEAYPYFEFVTILG